FTIVTDGEQATALPLGVRRQLTVIPVTVVDTLFHPGSGDAAVDVVRSLYRAILGREAEDGGLAFHAAQLRQFGVGQVVDSLWNSVEHRTQQVDAYYLTYLGRHLDPSAVGWIAALLTGAGEESVAAGILASAEYAARHAGNADFVSSLYPEL